ncbi:MAG: hypothetical protein JWQ81_275 [Amycolatopsis sp.]|uniref:putative T7SS-secreted protein n=1 Tax=Amycolatopsis sp. TaxID=37632 RepID=UPI00261A3911|nr:hypothetical protein [Amycolatopsis sp.]MCU1679536.1 hypothetical protein [Amycolatopsis sp.]
MAAELGQTTDPKALIPGEPETITSDLKRLVGSIQKMGGIGEDLHDINPGQWTGEASDAFRQAFGAEPPKWAQAVDLAADNGKALADFGDALTWGQSEAQRAIEQYTQAQAASRTAAAQYNTQAQAAQGAGQLLAPFEDPGKAAAQGAQAILDAARDHVEQVGGAVAEKLGFKKSEDGSYKKEIGEGKEFGADARKKQKKWDDKKKEWVEEDPGGWQSNKGGKSYSKEFGDQSGGMLTDKLGPLLEKLGIDTSESTVEASAGVNVAEGSLDGKFGQDGGVSGSGKIEGAVLGADASAHAGVSVLGVSAGANAEAYLAKGSVEGEVNLGDHAGVKASAEGIVGAKASADAELGWTGAQGSAEAFAGAKVEGDARAEVAGVTAGAHGEAWAGVGAEASGQVGMGDDGKFHLGASVGVGLGIGGKVGFDVSVDPAEVVDTVQDVAHDVGDVASDIGHGAENAAKSVGHFLGF